MGHIGMHFPTIKTSLESVAAVFFTKSMTVRLQHHRVFNKKTCKVFQSGRDRYFFQRSYIFLNWKNYKRFDTNIGHICVHFPTI